jgi:hypothetical protein
MKSTLFLRFLVAGMMALLTLASTAAAFAAPPTFQTIQVDDQFEDPFLTAKCGFPVLTHLQGPIKIGVHYDQAGNPVKEIQVYPHFQVTFVANGKSFTSPAPGVFIITQPPDGSPNTFMVVGLTAVVHLPGQGAILLDAGKLVFIGELGGPITSEVGPHQFFGTGDAAPFCAALAVGSTLLDQDTGVFSPSQKPTWQTSVDLLAQTGEGIPNSSKVFVPLVRH